LLLESLKGAPTYISYGSHTQFRHYNNLPKWQWESHRLLSSVAQASEDQTGKRFVSDYLPYRDLVITPDNPKYFRKIPSSMNLYGRTYRWGNNYRILAPEGYCFKKITFTVDRTNDPKWDSVCRLQVRRYRYVDIDNVWTTNTSETTKVVDMPPGCTWFYLRPEYVGKNNKSPRYARLSSSFNGWGLDAELVPLGSRGQLQLAVENCGLQNVYVDGVYARCYDGVVTNLKPGKREIELKHMWAKKSDFTSKKFSVDIKPDQVTTLATSMALNEKVKQNGYNDPVGVAKTYPWFKHRPKRDSTEWGSRPAVIVDNTGRYIAVWSHLDDIWMSTSPDGEKWSAVENVAAPANSAHVDLSPRLVQDESGKFCMIFLSDRGVLRNFSTYFCWSKDLSSWSRPVVVTEKYHTDHELMQDSRGRYIITCVENRSRNESEVSLYFSLDTHTWKKLPVIIDASSPERVSMVQDNQQVYHIVWSEGTTVSYTASAFIAKTGPDGSEASSVLSRVCQTKSKSSSFGS